MGEFVMKAKYLSCDSSLSGYIIVSYSRVCNIQLTQTGFFSPPIVQLTEALIKLFYNLP